MVYLVKVVIIVGTRSTSRIDAGASDHWEPERVALNLDSDKFRSFNHREELYSAVQLQIGPVAIYKIIIFTGSGYVSQENA